MNKKASSGGIIIVLVLLVVGYYFFIYEGGIHNPFITKGIQESCTKQQVSSDYYDFYINTPQFQQLTQEQKNSILPYLNQQILDVISNSESECLLVNGVINYASNVPSFTYPGDNGQNETFNDGENSPPNVCGVYCMYDGKNINAQDILNYRRLKENYQCRQEIVTILNNPSSTLNSCSLQCTRASIFTQDCLLSLIDKKDDLNLCGTAFNNDYEGKVWCYSNFAIKRNDPTICDVLPIASDSELTANNRMYGYQQGCYYRWVIRNGDFGDLNYVVARENCRGAYGKLGLDEYPCVSGLCHDTGGIWNQADLTCTCPSVMYTFDKNLGCSL